MGKKLTFMVKAQTAVATKTYVPPVIKSEILRKFFGLNSIILKTTGGSLKKQRK